jgi:hypothetical protein
MKWKLVAPLLLCLYTPIFAQSGGVASISGNRTRPDRVGGAQREGRHIHGR